MTLQTAGIIGSLALSAMGLVFSLIALAISLHDAHSDRINLNTWETYRAYNSDEVRLGRALSLKILQDTSDRGFESYEDYLKYFSIATSRDDDKHHSQERQYLHDLAAFYHQTGVLLNKNRLDRDFTLLLVGPGLEDRWNVFKDFAHFYDNVDSERTSLSYGGIYLLFLAYKEWRRTRMSRLKRAVTRAIEKTHQ